MKITIKRHGGDKTQVPAILPVIMKRAQTGASYTVPYSILLAHTRIVKEKCKKTRKSNRKKQMGGVSF